jgi:hypothetical protein
VVVKSSSRLMMRALMDKRGKPPTGGFEHEAQSIRKGYGAFPRISP